MTRLVSTTGKRWAFMERFDIPDLLDTSDIYLTRWRLIQTPWFAFYLHHIRRPDNDRHLHDHPWSFVTLILKGGYIEEVPGTLVGRSEAITHGRTRRTWLPGSVHRMRAEDPHRIKSLFEPCWTLVVTGPRRRDWGYHTESGQWVQHERYHHMRNPMQFPKADAR